ncbi:MAG: hypothetical protein R3F59_13210 [Myxococcota bacterium]
MGVEPTDLEDLPAASGPGYTLRPGPAEERPTGDLASTLQLVLFDAAGQVVSIREQPVVLVPARHREEPERVRAYLAGWLEAVQQVLQAVPPDAELYPADLVCADVLDLARAETAADFRAAALTASRLGGLTRPRRP